MTSRDKTYRERLLNVLTHGDISDADALWGVQQIIQEWAGDASEIPQEDSAVPLPGVESEDDIVVVKNHSVRRVDDPLFPKTQRGRNLPGGS